ncbi:efflux RND transporter permease subunit, partial [Acinetobacter baumannii]
PGEIIRYDRERRASVQADRAGASLSQTIAAVNRLPVMTNLPEGVKQATTGDVEAFKDLIGGFVRAVGSALFLIYAVLALLFRSFFKPAVILAALPL